MRIAILLITLLSFCAARAGGSYIGSGGDVVACEIWQLIDDPEGPTLAKVTQVWTLEYYFAQQMQNPEKQKNLKKWQGLSEATTLERLLKPLAGTEIFQFIQNSLIELGPITEGVGSTLPLKDISDSWNPFELKENCQLIQAVVRQKDLFVYDLNAWDLLGQNTSAHHHALMTFHEHLYRYAKEVRHHETSMDTMMLIAYLLSDDGSARELSRKLKTYDFID